MRASILVGALIASVACSAAAETYVTKKAPAGTPVQLQVPVGKGGLTVGVPVTVAPAGIAVGEPHPAIPLPGQDIARPAVQPPGYPQVSDAPKEPVQPKPRALKRSEIPDWPQLKAQ